MKLKMAKNSMFAVLLRSPWWISIGIVLLFSLVARAVLPEQYVVFGVMGAFPFLVVGVIAGFRQFRSPRAAEVARVIESVAAMPWREFATLLEQAYTRQGFSVSRPETQAVDLVLDKAGQTTLVAARRWKAASHGVQSLRSLVQARETQDASHCIYVSLADVNDNTRRFAVSNRVDLLSGTALAHLLSGSAGASKT